jgi:hypothetical protein
MKPHDQALLKEAELVKGHTPIEVWAMDDGLLHLVMKFNGKAYALRLSALSARRLASMLTGAAMLIDREPAVGFA